MSLKDKWEERNKKDPLEKATRGENETYQGKLKDQEMEEKTLEKDYFRNNSMGILGLLILPCLFFVWALPVVIAVTGFLCFFHELDWLYPLVSIGVWFLSQFVVYKGADEGMGMNAIYDGVDVGMGFVYMLSIPANIWFLINGIFLDGGWSKLIYSFVVGAFGKSFEEFGNRRQ